MVSDDERRLLRELARQVAEIAAGEANRRIVRRWRDVNALRKPDRAPVWCRPVGCWSELLPEERLLCRDESARDMERTFRQMLIKHDIGDDTPVEPTFDVQAVFDVEPANTYGVEIRQTHSGAEGGAWAFDPPLKDEADFERLRVPSYSYNAEATRGLMEWAADILGDILPVRLIAQPPQNATISVAAAELRGLTGLLLDLALEPERTHRLMAYCRDVALAGMDAVERSGLLVPNNFGPMYCGDPIGLAPQDGKYTLANCWVHGNSQEFDQVSPAMWEEFCLQYQRPIFERFGLAHYGCCENLTHKIDGVLSIPNLRIFTCSAWTDLD